MLGFDPQVEKAFNSQILRITEELGNYGWPKNIATRVLDVYLVAGLKNPNWLRTVSVFQRDDVTYVQYGVDSLFADRSDMVIDAYDNVEFVIHRYGKTLDSGIVTMRMIADKDSRLSSSPVPGVHCVAVEDNKETMLKQKEIDRIQKELAVHGWSKVVIDRICYSFLEINTRSVEWLWRVKVSRTIHDTIIQSGKFSGTDIVTTEHVLDVTDNDSKPVVSKTTDWPRSEAIKITLTMRRVEEIQRCIENKLKLKQINRIDKALWEKGWTKEVAQIVLNDYLDVDNRTADWLKDVRMYEKGDGTTIVRYGDGRMWGHAPETRTRHYGDNLEITLHASPGDNGTIELKNVKPEPVGSGIKDETVTIQAQHDKGNKMNQVNTDTSGVTPTVESVGQLLKVYGANDSVVATVQTLMTQYNLGDGSIVSYVLMGSNGDIHLTLGSYERFDNARRNGMLIGDQEVHWLLDHEGGVFHITRKKKELSKEELLKKHVGEFKLMVVTPKGSTEIPYDFVATERGEDGISLNVAARMEFYLKDGVFHNSKGPAYIAFNGRKNYVVNGQPLTEEEFKQLTNQGS